jgi:dipeptidyl-peptidase-4
VLNIILDLEKVFISNQFGANLSNIFHLMNSYSSRILLVAFTVIFSINGNGQVSKYLTVQDAILLKDNETGKSLMPKRSSQLNWLPGGKKFCYIENRKDQKLFIKNIETNEIDSSIDISLFNKALSAYKEDLSTKTFPKIEWIDNDNFKFFKNNEFLNFNIPSKSIRILLNVSKDAQFIEDNLKNGQVAYVENGNIFISNGSTIKQITKDGGNGIVYGETVHRNEFGISKGLFWSPTGKKIAFYRMDEHMVTDYSIYQNENKPATTKEIKYPCAGAKSHHVKIGIYSIEDDKVTYLETGEPVEHYLTNVAWGPDEEYIYVAIVNRGQNQCFFNQYNVSNGSLKKTLFEERDEKYVEPQHEMHFLTTNKEKFIWQSERDGYNHLYLYNTNGKMLKQLTSGNWVVTELLGVDQEGEYVYFEGTKESPLERHIYKVRIQSGDIRKLSIEQGTHSALFNKQFQQYINTFSSIKSSYELTLKDNTGENLSIIEKSDNPLSEYNLGETSIFPIINEGKILYCRMITPPNLDKSKKYPVVVYVYGGPHVQLVKNTWLGGSNLWMQSMAQKGYIVFSIDNRGSANRGHDFESSVFRNLGTNEISDQIAGVNYLKQLAYVDANRIAAHGWSFGGFMTTSLMTRTPGVFKVGVAGGPVIDWSLYEIMYTERYMDTPEENPEGYKKANLLNYTQNLQDKLLMIHGCDDDVVLWQHSLLYLESAVNAGNTYLDYFVYPGHKHNVLGKDRVHLYQKITEYIIEHL